MYSNHGFEIMGFAKAFDDKSHLDDLLSVTDFAAGVVQDLLQMHKTEIDFIPCAGKTEIIKWMIRESRFLSKITVQIRPMADGTPAQGLVHFIPSAPYPTDVPSTSR